MAETNTRRPPSRPIPIDVALFETDLAEALKAFAVDVSYAVAMARAAVTIAAKKRIWQARRDLRDAEARAHAECAAHPPFDCHATSACGTGDCKFAVGEHAALAIAAPGGTHVRPQYPHERYSLDEAVTALAHRRSPPR